MTTTGHNSEGMIESYVDRLERLDEERRALASDMKDLMDEAASSTGFSKVSFRNILKERRKSRAEVHATYVEMDAIRRALRMRDPLEPPEEDEPATTTVGDAANRVVTEAAE
ncbi:MAG: GapR family DNA-binding domain-containing protein [Xanthobacteraceae bacterium]